MSTLPRQALAAAFLLGSASAWATIVWKGKAVEAWPAEALATPAPGTGFAARSTAVARNGFFPSPKGKILSLTLLVDFSDSPTPYAVSEITDWLNQEGFNRDGCKGSVRDYYLDISNGQVELSNEAFGWYRAKKPKSYYEGLTGYTGAAELLDEVVDFYDPKVDFSRFDNDKDGVVDALNIIYTGKAETWNQGLWSHAGWLGKVADGVRLNRYEMSDLPGTFDLFTFVHETGHMLFGWPDLYYYGLYCLMGSHSDDQNPVMVNDFYRADQGWIPFQDVSASDTGLVLAAPGAKCYRLRNPARPTQEGIAWSYLANTGRRADLKGSGLFVQHYDLSLDENASATKLQLRPLQADKLEELQAAQFPTKSNDAKDLFQSGTTNRLDATFANNKWYAGGATGLLLTEIGKPGTTLSFRLGQATGTSVAPPAGTPIRIATVGAGWLLSAPAHLAGAQAELATPDGRVVSRCVLSASGGGASCGLVPTTPFRGPGVWKVSRNGRVEASGRLFPPPGAR